MYSLFIRKLEAVVLPVTQKYGLGVSTFSLAGMPLPRLAIGFVLSLIRR